MGVYQPHNSRVDRYLAVLALTSVNTLTPPPAQYAYTVFMQLPATDREIVQLVGRFKQLTTDHIKRLVYPGQLHNPQQRTINRLLQNKLLARVNERLPGGARGGSQMYVYQLGSQGRKLYGSGRRGHSIVINQHALAIADAYTVLFEADRRGEIKLLNWATEPDCHVDFGDVHLEPDLYIDVVTYHNGQARRWPRWLEIDMGTEYKRQVLDKIGDYSRAHASRDDYPLPIYPTTLYLVTRDERAAELRYWLRYAKDVSADVVEVGKLDELLQILQR